MAQLITIARPYADAAFANAKEAGKLTERSEELANFSMIASDQNMQALIANPETTKDQIMEVFTSIMKKNLSNEGQNLLTVMAENKRLLALPEVSNLFEDLKAEDEKRVRATIISARKVTVEQTKKLSAALNTKFDAEVEITSEVDASLISGIKIVVGDWAIDGSAQSQLNKLGAAIAQ
jgi:F-type H+-transporting ATPase subunit delta